MLPVENDTTSRSLARGRQRQRRTRPPRPSASACRPCENGAFIDPDVSIRTSVPPAQRGTFASASAAAPAPAPHAQRSDGAARYADRNRIGSCRDAATSRRVGQLAPRPSRRPRRHAGLVEVAQVAQQRHVAHRRDDRLPRRRVQRTLQPASDSAPPRSCRPRAQPRRRRAATAGVARPARAAQRARAASIVSDSPATARRRSCRRSSAYRNRSPCRGAGRRPGGSGRARRRSGTPLAAVSYLSSARSCVEAHGRVGDAALDRLRHARPWRRVQYASSSPGSSARCSAAATTARGARPMPAAARRARTYSAAPTSDAERRFAPSRSQRRNRAVQSGSATATSATSARKRASRSPARLVEGVLADHVGHRQQEQLRHQVPRIARPTLVGDPVLLGRRLLVELRHRGSLLSFFEPVFWRPVVRDLSLWGPVVFFGDLSFGPAVGDAQRCPVVVTRDPVGAGTKCSGR